MAIVTRGDTHRFHANFFRDADRTEPLVPFSSDYPSFAIYGPGNEFLTDGVALLDQTSPAGGAWYVDWTCPADAVLTYPGGFARIDWLMVTSSRAELHYNEEFDIAGDANTVTEEGALSYLTVPGNGQRVVYRTTTDVDDISLELTPVSTLGVPDTANSATIPKTGLTRVVDGNTIVYYYDVPGTIITTASSGYQLLWAVRQTVASPTEYVYQQLDIMDRCWFPYLLDLRLLIDKFKKRLVTPRGITDTDMYRFLLRGLEVVNGAHPNTVQWGVCTFPSGLNWDLIMASSLFALQSAFMVELDLSFTFSGQTTTLEYDHTSGIDSALAKATEYLSTLSTRKMGYVRRALPTAVVGIRPLRNGAHNLVYKVASGSTETMQSIGSLAYYLGL